MQYSRHLRNPVDRHPKFRKRKGRGDQLRPFLFLVGDELR